MIYRILPALALSTLVLAGNPAQAASVTLDKTTTGAGTALEPAIAALNAGNAAEAEALARQALIDNAISASAHEVLGAALAMQQKLSEAIGELQLAVTINPRQATAYTKLGDISIFLNQWGEAAVFFAKALAADPDNRHAHQRLGQMYEDNGAAQSAILHYERGLRGTDADYLGVKLNLANLYTATGTPDRALTLLQRWQGDDAAPPAAHAAIARAYLALGDGDKAVAEIQRGLTAAPADPGLAAEMAAAQAFRGDTAAAVEQLNRVRGNAAAQPSALLQAGTVATSLGDFETAAELYRQGIAAYPENPGLRFQFGALLGAEMDYAAALEQFEAGLALRPDHPVLLRGAMGATMRLGQTDAALAFAERLQAQGAVSASDHFLIGTLHEAEGDPQGARAEYEATLALDPEHWAAANNLAYLLRQAGEAEAALPRAQLAAERAPQDPAVQHTLGLILFDLGDYPAAVEHLERSVDARPEVPGPRFHLARALQAAGQPEAARAELQKALAPGAGDFPEAAAARDLLGSL